jgi:hypothetical protein
MKEIPAWRRKSFHTSLALVLINPVFFAVALPLADHLRLSNKVWGHLIAVGVFAGLISLMCGLLGKGHRRWILILASCVEIAVWSLMAAGL